MLPPAGTPALLPAFLKRESNKVKLIRSGSTIFAVSPQQSGSLVYPGYTKNGRLLNLADSHLSGNVVFNIVTNNDDGALWSQVGDSIQVATSASGDSQYTTNLRNCISYRFWDTGVKIKEDPCCTMEFVTHDSMTPYGNYGGTGVIHVMGFVTAPAGGIANINLADNAGGSYGTSWSSVRWTGMRWNMNTSHALKCTLRQGDNTFGWGSALVPDDTGTVNYHFQIKMSDLLFQWLPGEFEWQQAFTVVNYPGNDGAGDDTGVLTMATDSPVGSDGYDVEDHHIYAFVAVGRYGVAGDVQTILGKYKVWVQ